MTARLLHEKFRQVELFSAMPDDRLQAVVARAKINCCPKGSEILSFRDETRDVFFILEGRLQVRNYSAQGRELIYSEIAPGGLFGEFSAIDGLPRSASVIAMEDSSVARMTSADFLQLLKSDFDLNLRVLRLLTAKSRALTGRLLELIALSSHDRVRSELARLAADGVREGASITIRPAPTHYELAARVGSHREAVTKELNRLQSLGYIHLKRRQIVILDMDRFSCDLLKAQSA